MHPNPLTAKSVPAPVAKMRDEYLGRMVYALTAPQSSDSARATLKELGLSQGRLERLLASYASRRGYGVRAFKNGRRTAYGNRLRKLRSELR